MLGFTYESAGTFGNCKDGDGPVHRLRPYGIEPPNGLSIPSAGAVSFAQGLEETPRRTHSRCSAPETVRHCSARTASCSYSAAVFSSLCFRPRRREKMKSVAARTAER